MKSSLLINYSYSNHVPHPILSLTHDSSTAVTVSREILFYLVEHVCTL